MRRPIYFNCLAYGALGCIRAQLFQVLALVLHCILPCNDALTSAVASPSSRLPSLSCEQSLRLGALSVEVHRGERQKAYPELAYANWSLPPLGDLRSDRCLKRPPLMTQLPRRGLFRRLQAWRFDPFVPMRRGVGSARFRKESIALRPGWQFSGQFASCFCPIGQPIVKGNGLLDTATTLHGTTS